MWTWMIRLGDIFFRVLNSSLIISLIRVWWMLAYRDYKVYTNSGRNTEHRWLQSARNSSRKTIHKQWVLTKKKHEMYFNVSRYNCQLPVCLWSCVVGSVVAKLHEAIELLLCRSVKSPDCHSTVSIYPFCSYILHKQHCRWIYPCEGVGGVVCWLF